MHVTVLYSQSRPQKIVKMKKASLASQSSRVREKQKRKEDRK